MKKKIKSKYGVFNGANISDDILNVEKNVSIQELSNESFTIEKINDKNLNSEYVLIDHHTIMNKKNKFNKIVLFKWATIGITLILILIALVFLIIKISK